ncbi:MAG: hypothetical protein V1826_02090 [bacterium]
MRKEIEDFVGRLMKVRPVEPSQLLDPKDGDTVVALLGPVVAIGRLENLPRQIRPTNAPDIDKAAVIAFQGYKEGVVGPVQGVIQLFSNRLGDYLHLFVSIAIKQPVPIKLPASLVACATKLEGDDGDREHYIIPYLVLESGRPTISLARLWGVMRRLHEELGNPVGENARWDCTYTVSWPSPRLST